MAITIDGSSGIASVDGSAGSPSIRGDDSNSGIYYGTDIIYMSTGGVQRWKLTDGGDIQVPDSCKFEWGAGQDLAIYFDGSNSYIKGQGAACGSIHIDNSADADQNIDIKAGQDIYLRTTDGSQTSVRCERGGPVYLYNTNNLRFYTETNGNTTRCDVNSANKFTLRNLDTTSGSNNHTNVIEFKFNRTGGGMDSSGARVLAGKEREWVGGASNQDGFLAFWTMLNESVGEKFRIASNGDLTATDTSISSNSDSRLKTNIANYNYDLAKFKQLHPKTFDWKNPAMHGGKSGVRGFVAQDIEAVDPYWVSSEKVVLTYDVGDNEVANPDLSLLDADGIAKTSKLGQKDAMYISIINQLIAKIETLETKVAALEAA